MRFNVLFLGAAALWALVVPGCSNPQPITSPVDGPITLTGNVVRWETSEQVMGSVRYGRASGQYDHVAYPEVNLRGDRALRSIHNVPLISVRNGETIFLQVLNRSESNTQTASGEVSFTVSQRPTPMATLTWTMIDVGFGDSHFLSMPTSEARILIDGGERRDWPNVDAFLQNQGVQRLQFVMGTHIHADHIGGLVGDSFTLDDGVLGAYPVGLYIDYENKSASRFAYDELLETLEEHEISSAMIAVGDTEATNSALAWDAAVRVQALNAGGGRSIGGDREGDWLNNDSALLRITYGSVSFVMGGDSEAPVEQRVLSSSGSALESHVLKVHHHGLDDTSVAGFLDAVQPRVGMIPIATYESNNGTLPSGEVLSRLRSRAADIYASDRAEPLGLSLTGNDGINVTVSTDGVSYEIDVARSVSDHFPPNKPGLRSLFEGETP